MLTKACILNKAMEESTNVWQPMGLSVNYSTMYVRQIALFAQLDLMFHKLTDENQIRIGNNAFCRVCALTKNLECV